MKIESKHVRFLPVLPWFGRRPVRFVGTANTLQLLETALVIEGQRKMLGLFWIDLFFQQALSEWTMVTIPYSRIERCRFSRQLLVRGLFLLVFVLPAVISLIVSIPVFWMTSDAVSMSLPLLTFALILLEIYAIVRILPSRFTLRFRRADGRLARTHFRITSRIQRRIFEQRLDANRKAADSSTARADSSIIGHAAKVR